MIIFDLDGTLADCEHRRHFVDPEKNGYKLGGVEGNYRGNWTFNGIGVHWKPDWKSFYEACDKDEPINSVINIFESIGEAAEYGSDTPWVDYDNISIQIWSGRCESVRKKTEKWLSKNLRYYHIDNPILKMRPIGDYTPDDQLKEKWLDEAISQSKTIEFVFDDRPKVIRMWRRRGIFVFNCAQHDEEF